MPKDTVADNSYRDQLLRKFEHQRFHKRNQGRQSKYPLKQSDEVSGCKISCQTASDKLTEIIEKYQLFNESTSVLNLTFLSSFEELTSSQMCYDADRKFGAEVIACTISNNYSSTSHLSYISNGLRDPSNLLLALSKTSLRIHSLCFRSNDLKCSSFVPLLRFFRQLQSIDIRCNPIYEEMSERERITLKDEVVLYVPGLLFFCGGRIDFKYTSLPWFKCQFNVQDKSAVVMMAFYESISSKVGPVVDHFIEKFYCSNAQLTLTLCLNSRTNLSRWITQTTELSKLEKKLSVQSFDISKVRCLQDLTRVQQNVIRGSGEIAVFLQNLLQSAPFAFAPSTIATTFISPIEKMISSKGTWCCVQGGDNHEKSALYFHRTTTVNVDNQFLNDIWFIGPLRNKSLPHWTPSMGNRIERVATRYSQLSRSIIEDCVKVAESDRMLDALLEITGSTRLRAERAAQLWYASDQSSLERAKEIFESSKMEGQLDSDFFYP